MHPLSRRPIGVSLAVVFAFLTLASGDLRIEATRRSATREWTSQLSNRADIQSARSVADNPAIKQQISNGYGRLPLSFEKNEGQTDPRVEFLSRGSGRTLFLSASGEAVLALSGTASAAGGALDTRHPVGAGGRGASLPNMAAKGETSRDAGAVLRLKPVGASRKAHAEGRERLPGKVNYLRGNDSARWRTGIPTYARVAYENVYPGVDLVYYGNQRQLEYDFIVRPGVDPRVIALEAEGADRLEVDERGDLVMHVGNRQVRQQKPVVYQEVRGVRHELDGRYALQGSSRVTFRLGAYDPTLALVIDPVLVYSTYLGSAALTDAFDSATAVAVDAGGRAYVTGSSSSSDFSTTLGAHDTSYNGGQDVFVAKLDATGTTIIYSTFLGGSQKDVGLGIALDATGEAYVTGSTSSSDFPTPLGAYDSTYNGGVDGFVTKLDAAGERLIYSTFLGGANEDAGQGIAVDAAGAAYVTGYTNSSATIDSSDAFVTKLGAAGEMAYSTFLGGASTDKGLGIAVDAAGAAYATGYTNSSDFPATAGTNHATVDSSDAFVTKLSAAGEMAYSTFLGGASTDKGLGIAVDAVGQAYVTGFTSSRDFPTFGAFGSTYNGGVDGFVTKLDAAGEMLVYSTFLGGANEDAGQGIAVDAASAAYVTGYTNSGDFPATAGTNHATVDASDAFVTELGSAGTLVYSTVLGGTQEDIGQGIAVDAAGDAYVAGLTSSFDFPTTPGAYNSTYHGPSEAFVTKIAEAAGPSTVQITPSTATNTVGQEHCVIAMVRDASGNSVRDVTVRFSVTGPNANIDSGWPVTSANGEASFCYTGTHAGIDTIWAFADTDNDRIQDDGEPGDTAAKTYRPGAPAALILTPAGATNTAGAPHCVTAAVLDSFGNPTPDVTVRFTVTGANTAGGSAMTDENGGALFCYTGTHAGADTIRAFADTNNDGSDVNEPAGTAAKTYLPAAPAALILTPPAASNTVGEPHSVTAAVRDSFGNLMPNVTVRFSVTGAIETSGTALTDAFGQATFSYAAALPGADVIRAYADTDNDNSPDAGEQGAAASKTWQLPLMVPGCGSVYGIGYIPVGDRWAAFAFDIDQTSQSSQGPTLDGELAYLAWGRKLFRATVITRLIITDKNVTIHGSGSEYGSQVVKPFRVDVVLTQPETFQITWPGYTAGGSVTGEIVMSSRCGHDVHRCDGDFHHRDGGSR